MRKSIYLKQNNNRIWSVNNVRNVIENSQYNESKKLPSITYLEIMINRFGFIVVSDPWMDIQNITISYLGTFYQYIFNKTLFDDHTGMLIRYL